MLVVNKHNNNYVITIAFASSKNAVACSAVLALVTWRERREWSRTAEGRRRGRRRRMMGSWKKQEEHAVIKYVYPLSFTANPSPPYLRLRDHEHKSYAISTARRATVPLFVLVVQVIVSSLVCVVQAAVALLDTVVQVTVS